MKNSKIIITQKSKRLIMSIQEIKELVVPFRKAIESAIANDEPGYFFSTFPTGQCGNASDLLAQYFLDNGINEIEYVCGTYRDEHMYDIQSHAWLVLERKIIVDITGDQFKNSRSSLKNDIPIYVGPITDYYKQFDTPSRDRHRHYGLQPEWGNYSDAKGWYQTILVYIKRNLESDTQ